MIFGSMRVLPQLCLTMLAHLAASMLKNTRMSHGSTLLDIRDGDLMMTYFQATITSKLNAKALMFQSL